MEKRLVFVFAFVLLLIRGSWASPFLESRGHHPSQKPHHKALHSGHKILFPARLDQYRMNFDLGATESLSPSAGFDGALRQPIGESLFSQSLLTQNRGDYKVSSKSRVINHKLMLESQYLDYEHLGPRMLQDPNEYSKILKSTSLGIAYPLTPRLTLDGRYAVLKGEHVEAVTPLFGATYRFNPATSISLSYRHSVDGSTPISSEPDTDNTSAELKVHF